MHNVRHSLGACAVLVVVGCSQDLIPPSDPLPEVISATIEANSTMVVAATVRVSGFGDSVRVAFHLEGATGSDSVSAPVMLPLNGAVDVPVLGLLPQASYLMRAVVFFRGDSAVSGSLAVTTGALPPDLPARAAHRRTPTNCLARSLRPSLPSTRNILTWQTSDLPTLHKALNRSW